MYHNRRGVAQNMPGGSRTIGVYPYHNLRVNDSYYSSDEFRMFGFKILPCPRTQSHDWTNCPMAHRGEKAQRRDPSVFSYMAVACPYYKTSEGTCPRGDTCCFAHGIFEYWLHPAKYRTRPCHMGHLCRRKVCFFAHGPAELRTEVRYKVHWSGKNSLESVTPLTESQVRYSNSADITANSSMSLENSNSIQPMAHTIDDQEQMISEYPLNMMISRIIDDDEVMQRLGKLRITDTAWKYDDEATSSGVNQGLPNLPEIEW